MKKLLLAICLIFVMVLNANAIPGVNPFIKNQSGMYVYYRDYSFNRESYLGFLIYDEGTYAARYFAPGSDKDPPKEIEILFTIDPKKDYVDLTGERFLTPIVQEDTDVINYIHDMIYEFASRRKKAGDISPDAEKNPGANLILKKSPSYMESGFISKEDFNQFGGEVFVYYDYTIPIFNIKKIIDNSRKTVFEAVAAGRIKSSADKSFSSFRPLEANWTPIQKKNKKEKSFTAEIEGTKINLDEGWSNKMGDSEAEFQNIYFRGNDSLLSIFKLDEKFLFTDSLMTVILSENSYTPLNSISISEEGSRITVYSTSIDAETGRVYERIFIFRENSGSKHILFLNLLKSEFESDRKYYLNILKTWK